MSATRDALLAGGWRQRDVPLLGDESIGFESSGTAAGGASNAGHGFVFRFGRHLIGAIVTGPASSTSFDQALGYAVQMSARLDAMLAVSPVTDPDPAPAGTVASTAPTVAASAASTSSSRPRVVNRERGDGLVHEHQPRVSRTANTSSARAAVVRSPPSRRTSGSTTRQSSRTASRSAGSPG